MDPANAGLIRDWTVAYWEALHPSSEAGAYVNFMMDEGVDRVRATYRDNYERLVHVKDRYDRTNLFHVNQNVQADGVRPAPAPPFRLPRNDHPFQHKETPCLFDAPVAPPAPIHAQPSGGGIEAPSSTAYRLNVPNRSSTRPTEALATVPPEGDIR